MLRAEDVARGRVLQALVLIPSTSGVYNVSSSIEAGYCLILFHSFSLEGLENTQECRVS